MRFVFGKQDMPSLERTREQCWLLANGLGGFASLTGAFSASRLDHSVLMAAVSAPAVRVNLVHRLREELEAEGELVCLSTQQFAGGRPAEEGFRHLSSFVWEDGPAWLYHVRGGKPLRRALRPAGAALLPLRPQGGGGEGENRPGLAGRYAHRRGILPAYQDGRRAQPHPGGVGGAGLPG